jgi:NADH-quinone oxidoreductase subunit L
MMCALGAGGYTAGLFHLTTHAFFKALLFLGAGSVIHAVHTNDMRAMGGLSKKMPITFLTMGVAVLAIAGFPFLSGYYSKDMILGAVWHHNHTMFWILLASALMTAFYMSRLFFLTFWGSDRDHEKFSHAHESPGLITGPLLVLALFSALAGAGLSHGGFIHRAIPAPTLSAPKTEAAPEKAAEGAKAEAEEAELPGPLSAGVIVLVLSSIGLAFGLYRGPNFSAAEKIRATFSPLVTVLDRRWYLDDVFLALVALSDRVAALAFWIDANVIDRIFVDGWGLLMRIVAELSNFFDNAFVDGGVDGVGALSGDLGVGLRWLVIEGQVQEYLMYAAIAFALAAMLILTR